ncbi:glycoside hydrolase family 43 protein [Halalkalibacter sp. APA_J-10(15)]|uniref:glycoside hydrolase family 43 protein n=1 Tax=Halalkalibacter sp. APA_J-10(15) TaxID=2933805 RepID=UPI001FF426EF|nr:glycoside hydrolase family 43 protein [Halalkalibacter sp. APA_J-10(15)]MCK0471069.1 glycoside hydrolase family 43 protein [Halalkalibacter sp. APA_J-10(15)]
MVKKEEIQLRDPFVFVDNETNKYYLFGSTDPNIWEEGIGFDVYISEDLEYWDGPFPVFRPSDTFYSKENFWAPEVHEHKGKYFTFATFLRKGSRIRGTGILCSNSLTGPFLPHSEGPVTPEDWHCLDGTLHVDGAGEPWIVFCHEWVQIADGELCAQRLSTNLKHTIGKPITLFKASEAPWTTAFKHRRFPNRNNYVTDGPYLFHSQSGELMMLWSSFIDHVYAQGIARSTTGQVLGPWVQEEEALLSNDGGHGMVFSTFEGQRMLTLHTPNKTPLERPIFIKLDEVNGQIVVRRD